MYSRLSLNNLVFLNFVEQSRPSVITLFLFLLYKLLLWTIPKKLLEDCVDSEIFECKKDSSIILINGNFMFLRFLWLKAVNYFFAKNFSLNSSNGIWTTTTYSLETNTQPFSQTGLFG